jgi:hypothetical protein
LISKLVRDLLSFILKSIKYSLTDGGDIIQIWVLSADVLNK